MERKVKTLSSRNEIQKPNSSNLFSFVSLVNKNQNTSELVTKSKLRINNSIEPISQEKIEDNSQDSNMNDHQSEHKRSKALFFFFII